MMTRTATMPAPTTGAGVPAGLNEPQTLAWKRLQVARTATAQLPPLDPAWLADEAMYERWRNTND